MDKAIVYGLVILFLGIAIGYSINDMATVDETPEGMQIPEATIFGSGGENNSTYVLGYDIILYNPGNEGVFVNSVEPVLNDNLSKMLFSDNISVDVGRVINGTSWVEVSGQVEFNTTGLSKEELEDIGATDSGILGYRITSTETMYLPGYKNEM
ncbi:hypothetical protein [Methanococcoides sp. FTZ1]|uniref:hypothetical protein n=1 Tax=Methanococcoides sp. FTZ1 TaxID=3439061 RepID=UPI003F871EA5